MSHRRVGDLGPGGHAGFGERFQNLRSPDNGHVGGFTYPEDLFLNLGDALPQSDNRGALM